LNSEAIGAGGGQGESPHYFKPDWREHYRGHLSPLYKRAIYAATRPLISWNASRHLMRETLDLYRPDYVFVTRGWPLEWLRKLGSSLTNLSDATILVQGTGTGWDAITWAALRPKRVIATDLFASPEAWEEIARFCRDTYGTRVDFHEAPLQDHRFLPDGSIDLCGSDAVFEHVKDFPEMLAESFRVLKPGGSLYATYGPLWYSAAGDHYSTRGGLENVFNHVILSDDSYRAYFYKHLNRDEDWQGAARYYELDLFSRLTTRQYLDHYRQAGFARRSLILFVSPEAVAFKKRFPERFRAIVRQMSGTLAPDDLVIAGNSILLQKPE